MDLLGFWEYISPLDELAAKFSFGEDITRDDMAAVLNALIAFHQEHHGFDFTEIIEMAKLTKGNIVEIFWVALEAENKDWLITRHGEAWLFHAVNDKVDYFGTEARLLGAEYAAVHLRLYQVIWKYILKNFSDCFNWGFPKNLLSALQNTRLGIQATIKVNYVFVRNPYAHIPR